MDEIKQDKWKELHSQQSAFTANKDMGKQKHLIESYFFIFDCIANNMLFTNTSFTTITGFDALGFTVEQLVDMIHPEDLPYFFSCEERGLAFTNKLSFNEHFQYLFSYTYRIITAKRHILTIQQQCQAIEVDLYGHLSKTLVTHRIIDGYKERPANDYKIFDKASNFYIDTENRFNLSNRELEILALIKDGKSSAETADFLKVSKHTIDTHRKNILNKTKSANFIELIRKLSFQE